MMKTRELTRPPQVLPLYLRAAATLVPGAGRLPGLPGGGGDIPEIELVLRDAPLEPDRLAQYRSVCGFRASGPVPPTFLHMPAFPLHMALMSDERFPFGAVGLVHIENEISQLRPVEAGERVNLSVRAGQLEPHPRGRTFSIYTSAHVDGEPVWRERSTMLRRGGGSGSAGGSDDRAASAGRPGAAGAADAAAGGEAATWKVPEDLGRRYGAVSGDRNPIHLHALAAKAFGFPRAIAHGMWTKARCLAALEDELPEAFTVTVAFRKPVLLPATVAFVSKGDGSSIAFALTGPKARLLHLEGRVTPVAEDTAGAEAELGTGNEKGDNR